jgi:hypothetical protein
MIACKIVIYFWGNTFVYILNTQVLKITPPGGLHSLTLEINHYLRQGRNSQTVHSSFHKPEKLYCTVRSQNQVIFKLYLATVQIVSASAPEVTSMQVFECIGEQWKYPLQISSLEVWLPHGAVSRFKGFDWPPFFPVTRGADLATDNPKGEGSVFWPAK